MGTNGDHGAFVQSDAVVPHAKFPVGFDADDLGYGEEVGWAIINVMANE